MVGLTCAVHADTSDSSASESSSLPDQPTAKFLNNVIFTLLFLATMAQEGVLSYHDVVLYPEDVETLLPGAWLNDNILSFAFEWLTHGHPTLSHQGQLALLPPSVVQMMFALEPTDLIALLESWHLPQKTAILLPISDSEQLDTARSGSHWTLMVWNLASRTLTLYDSMHLGWSDKHQLIAAKLGHLVEQTINPTQCLTASCPTQRNGFDCGLHVLSNAEQAIAEHIQVDAGLVLPTSGRQYLIVSCLDLLD